MNYVTLIAYFTFQVPRVNFLTLDSRNYFRLIVKFDANRKLILVNKHHLYIDLEYINNT